MDNSSGHSTAYPPAGPPAPPPPHKEKPEPANGSRRRNLQLAGVLLLAVLAVIAGLVLSRDNDGEEPVAESGAPEVGTAQQVADYNLTVTGVDTDATEELKSVAAFNEDPQGNYVLVDISAEYLGTGSGTPSEDLQIQFVAADGSEYGQCKALMAKPMHNVPAMANGDTAKFQTCMDVPSEDLAGATIRIGSYIWVNEEEDEVDWAVK
ncbi:hypothetical protein [Arthrobacter sp. YD2]|uniref:hypothetical protein n=1 Tax=Arthrobacter sp. YD2 TaxID=3058046 RepID=UPI0025B52646|nr:hypothetical protein [Arthrobacter sp. YD2]MDN3905615.1 hypothetical protein [Arthrobacter sp. YD2]